MGRYPDGQGGNTMNRTHYAYGFWCGQRFNEWGGALTFEECNRLAHQTFSDDFQDVAIVRVDYVDGQEVRTGV